MSAAAPPSTWLRTRAAFGAVLEGESAAPPCPKSPRRGRARWAYVRTGLFFWEWGVGWSGVGGAQGWPRINRERADRDGLGRAERIRAGPDGIRKLRVGTGRVGRAGAGTGHFCLYAVTDGSFLI